MTGSVTVWAIEIGSWFHPGAPLADHTIALGLDKGPDASAAYPKSAGGILDCYSVLERPTLSGGYSEFG